MQEIQRSQVKYTCDKKFFLKSLKVKLKIRHLFCYYFDCVLPFNLDSILFVCLHSRPIPTSYIYRYYIIDDTVTYLLL